MPRGRQERTVQADDVGPREQVRQRRVLAVLVELGVVEGVVRQQLTSEPLHDPGEGHADLAGAYDAHRLAVQRAAEEAVEREVGLAHAVVGAVGVAVQGLHERHSEFGDGLGAVRRHVGDEEPAVRGGVEVHVVVSGAAQQDGAHAQRVQSCEHVFGQRVVHEDADGGGARGEGHGLEIQRKLVVYDLDVAAGVGLELGRRRLRLGKVDLVIGLGGEDGKLHFECGLCALR